MRIVAGADFFGLFGAVFAHEHAEGGFDFFTNTVVFVLRVADKYKEEVVDIGEDVFGAMDVYGEGGDVSGLHVAHEFFVGTQKFTDLFVTEDDPPVLFAKNDTGLETHFVFAGADAEEYCVMDYDPHIPGGLLRHSCLSEWR